MDDTGPERPSAEQQAYNARQSELEKKYPWKYVVFKGASFIGAWDTREEAEAAAAQRFGASGYLVQLVQPASGPGRS
jgi:hypothetical protein